MKLSTLCDSVTSLGSGMLSVFATGDGAFNIESAGPDGSVKRLECKGHAKNVLCVAISPDARLVASGAADHMVKMWAADTGTLVSDCKQHTDEVNRLAFSADGQTLLSGDKAGVVFLWHPSSGARKAEAPRHSSPITALACSDNGTLATSASHDGAIRLWNLQTGNPVADCIDGSRPPGSVFALTLSPDGKCLASGGDDNRVKIWDTAAGRLLNCFEGHKATVTCLAFYPDQDVLASGSEDTTIKIWHIEMNKMLHDMGESLEGPVQQLLFDRQGKMAFKRLSLQPREYAISSDGRITPDRCPPGVEFVLSSDGTVIGTPDTFESLAFSPDCQFLAAGSWNGAIRIVELQSNQYKKCLGHLGTVHRIVFSYDSRLMASAAEDNTVRIWDPRTGLCLGTLFFEGRVTIAFVYRPPATQLMVVDRAGTVHQYEIELPKESSS